MTNDFWHGLGLKKAKLAELVAFDDVDEQPRPFDLKFPGLSGDGRTGVRDPLNRQEPVERIVNTILICAIRDGASEIEIEPAPGSVTVRYRVRGRMRDHLKLPFFVLSPLVAHCKKLGHLDPRPEMTQCGNIALRVDDQDYDLQISTTPTEHGERVLLRLGGGNR